jgi:hypothetical protein
MSTQVEIEAAAKTSTEKLALARKAFRDFHSRCFWFMREDAQLSEEDVPEIERGLSLPQCAKSSGQAGPGLAGVPEVAPTFRQRARRLAGGYRRPET